MSTTQGGFPPQEGVTESNNPKGKDQAEEDDTTHSPEYNDKFRTVLSYKPFLETMIQRLEKATDKSREAQLIKMQSLYNILFNPTKQLKLGTILRCEKVLKSLYEKIEKSTLLPDEIKAVKEQVGGVVNVLEQQTVPVTNTQKPLTNKPVTKKKEAKTTELLTTNKNLINECKTINLNDSTKSDSAKTQSKVNEESRRKLCNIIKKQRQEESPSKAISNTNEQAEHGCKVSTRLPLPSDEKPVDEGIPSEMFNKHLNVFNSNKETSFKNKVDISDIDKTMYDNFLPHGGSTPFSSTASDDYSFESLDRDDSKRYLAWNEPNALLSDQSQQREIMDLNTTKQKLLSLSPQQNISNLSPGLSKNDKNIFAPLAQQDNYYMHLPQHAGIINSEILSTSQHATPCEIECANLNSFKSNNNSEPSKLLSPENRPQSLRQKLTEQISAVHKVGTSCGGALRGLVNREDKIITPTRMANLKAGTILDLIGQDKPLNSRMAHVKAKPNLAKLHDEMPKLHNIQAKPNLGKLHDEMPKLHNTQAKPNLGKLHNEMSALHNIPLPQPQDPCSTSSSNNITNSSGLSNLGFGNNSTLDALTKMNPKELERLVHDHILKLPGSSETIQSNLDKEKDFLNKKPNAEIDRITLNRNCSNPNIRPLLQHTSDPRKGFQNVRTALNVPRYEAPVQRLPNPNQSGFSAFSQRVRGNMGKPLYNAQAPASNIAQSNHKFVYSAATHDNRSQTYNSKIESNDYLHIGAYKKPELKVPENIGGRNPKSNSYVNYNNPTAELNSYPRSLNTNVGHYQQTSFNQSEQFKWSRRPSTSTDSNTGYNPPNRHPVIPTNANKNFNISREDRPLNSEKHSRSLTSQRPISIRDPRRKSVEETFNRSNSNRTEQSKNAKNFDPRLSRNPKRNTNDFVSNRDPRVRDSFSSSPHRQKSPHQKKSVENDFKTKGTFSSPLDKLYSTTTDSKTGKGYGPQKFKIPKLKTASSQNSDNSFKNQTSAIDTSKNIKFREMNLKVDEHNEDNHLKCLKNKTEERSNKDASPNHYIDKDESKCDDSDDEIKPPRNSRQKRNRWDETEKKYSNSKTSDDKKVASRQERKTEATHKAKEKVEKEPKTKSVQKRKNEISKPKDTITDTEQEMGTEDPACSKTAVNEFRDKAISESKDLEKEISPTPKSEENPCSESKIKDEDLRDIFPSSLFDLLASEEKMKFFSKLGENLNAEKLKKIKRIIESNSDEEEDSKKSIPPPVANELAGPNTIEKDKILTSSFSDLLLEDEMKEEEEIKEEDKISENNQIVKDKEENVVQNLCSKNSNMLVKSPSTNNTILNNEESHQENVCFGKNDPTIICEIGLEECHKSLDAIENVSGEETLVAQKYLKPKNKTSTKRKSTKKGTNKKTIQKKTLNSSALDSVKSIIETSTKPKKKQKNELEKLQEDIRDMFISQGVVSATGMRLCRLKKTIDTAEGNDSPNKEHIGPVLHENKLGRKSLKDKKNIISEESDVSEEDTDEARHKKKTPVRRTSNKSSISYKKSDKDSVSVASSDGSEEDIKNTRGKKKIPVCRTSTKSSFSYKKSDKDSVSMTSSEDSEEDIEGARDRKKTPVRRTSTKSSVSCKKSDKGSVSVASSDASEESKEEAKDKKKTPVNSTSTKSSCKKNDNNDANISVGGKIDSKQNISDSNCKEKLKVLTDVSKCEGFCSPRVILQKADITKFEKKLSEFVTVETQLEQKSVEENKIEEQSSEAAVTKDQSFCVDSTNISSAVNNSVNIDQGSIEKCLKAKQVIKKYNLKRKNKKKPKWQLGVLEKKKPRKKVETTKDECKKEKLDVDIDINYYQEKESVIYKCKICLYEGKMIVRHYTIHHPGEEVMVSRISPNSAKQAIEESKNKQFNLVQDNFVDSKCKNKGFNCRMCSRTFPTSVIFFDHITFHTGEYRYECHICKYRISSKSGLKSHLLASHNEGKKLGVELKGTVYDDPPHSNIVLGFLCSECNFVQLISENMNKHLSKHGENSTGQLPKAITINLSKPAKATIIKISKPVVSNEENSNIDSVSDTKDSIAFILDDQIQTNEIDEKSDSFSDIKIEQPNDIVIIDVNNTDTDENEGFEEDDTVTRLEDVVEPSTEDVQVAHVEQEGSSNSQKQVALNVFLGYDDIRTKDSELNVERERIMNDIITKLKTQTKPQKGSVLDQIKSKLTMSIIEYDCTPQNSKKKDAHNENDSIRNKSVAKEKLTDSMDNYCSPEENDVPVRRTLPERSCKDKGQGLYTDENIFNNIEEDSDSSNSGIELELQKYLEELRMSCSDHSEIDEDICYDLIKVVEMKPTAESPIKNKPMASTITRLQDTLSRPDTVFNVTEDEIQIIDDNDGFIISGTTLLSEPSWLVSVQEMDDQIIRYACGSVREDVLPLRVGPLEVINSNGCVTFNCHHCEFLSTSILVFGEHIKSHRFYSWDGRCTHCKTTYRKGDEVQSSYALPTTFSHLLVNHLFDERTHTDVIPTSTGLMRRVPPPPPIIPLPEFYESQNQPIEPPKALLRVRRLSGDKLSVPDAENSLAPINNLQVQDVSSIVFQEANVPEPNCYETMQDSCMQQTAEDESCTFLRIESVVSLRPENADDFNQTLMDVVDVSVDDSPTLPSDRPQSYISLMAEESAPLESDPLFQYETPHSNVQELTPTNNTVVPANSQLVSITTDSPTVSTGGGSRSTTKSVGRAKTRDLNKSLTDFKSPEICKKMLVRNKLCHFYKCMGRVCTFSCESMEKFAIHYEQHRSSLQVQQDSEKGWKVCPYCFDPFECARDYCIHMKKEHGYSNMQCSYCFYRAASLGNVLYHQNTTHITNEMLVLDCPSQGLGPPPPRVVNFDNFIKPFVCGQGMPNKCNFYTFIPETFRLHLQNTHSRLSSFRCHLCVGFTARLDRLVEHYKVHAIAMYQCLYCIHGETIEDLMRQHLCYSHSNQQPCAVKRIDITKRYPSPTKLNLERLKRINFRELEQQKHVVIQCPFVDEDEVASSSATVEPPPNLPSTSNTVTSTDDDIQIIQTIKKRNVIHEVICLESSDEDECVVVCEKTPVISKKRTRPPEDSHNAPTVSQDDTPPSMKRCKEDLNKESCLNAQPSTSKSDVINLQDTSSDSNSNNNIENPKSGLTGTALYQCGYKGCDFGSKNSVILREHILKCELFSPAMTCGHCSRSFKYVSSFIEHIRVHGTLRYRCSICEYKGPVAARVSSHMKNIHKISSTKVEPMNPREKDCDTDNFVCIPKVTGKGGKYTKRKGNSKSKTQTKFLLTDIDKIPYRSIFSSPLGCLSCNYETKVRSNLVQHLTLHAAGHSVPQEESVNPVPCLAKKEKMFDKMMNLANSSNKNLDKFLTHEMEIYFPMYIPTNQRYVCHAKGCTYVTIDDSMLRYHIRTLHNEETTYRCPHCPSNDPASLTPIDKLSTHLKMHDTKLYACSSCNYYHFSRYVCEKHVLDRHAGLVAFVRIIRETGTPPNNTPVEDEPKAEASKTENLLAQPSGSGVCPNTPDKKNYHCNLCKFRSEEQVLMRKHSKKSHGMTHQYKCRLCKYESDVFSDFDDHFAKLHPNLPTTVITSFSQIVGTPSTSVVQTSGTDTTQGVKTYWRRNMISVKHIRGILVDDEPASVVTPQVISEPVTIKEVPKPDFLIPPPHPIYGTYGEPSPENHFKCPKCNHTYRYKSEFRIHLCKELDYTPWVCTHCSRCYINKSSITKHIRVAHDRDIGIESIMLHHPNKEVEQWVETMFTVQKSLMKKKTPSECNRKTVPKKRKASVETINQKTVVPETKKNQQKTRPQKIAKEEDLQQTSLKKNKKVEGKQNTTQRKRNFKCGYCSTATVLRKSLRTHQLKKHPGLPVLILDSNGTPEAVRKKTLKLNVPLNICEEEEDASEIEIKDSEDKESTYSGTPYYTCYYCKWSSKTISDVKDHWKCLHKDAVLLSGGKCKANTGVIFLYKKSKTTSETEYACKWCTERGTLTFLKAHLTKEHVGLKFGISQVLKTKYKCSKCNIIVNSVEVLKRHISSEHPKMQLPEELESDSKIISADKKNDTKRFRCPKCSYSSHIFKNAVRHLVNHFRTFQCGVCEHPYLSQPGVRSHMSLKHPDSSVKPKVIASGDIDIATIKKQIIVVQKNCDTKFESTEFNEPQTKRATITTKTVVPPSDTNVSDAAAASNSKPKGSPSSVVSCKGKIRNKNPIDQVKLNPAGNSKDLLKTKYSKIKADKKTKSLTLKKTSLKTNESVKFTSNDKIVKMGLRSFTKLFDVHPKIHIEPLIVHP